MPDAIGDRHLTPKDGKVETKIAIKLIDLTKSFGRGKNRIDAVQSLDLEVEGQQVFGFLGPNGAGKTTTIRLLMDLIRPNSGVAHIFGYEVSKHPEILHRVGALVEDASFYTHKLIVKNEIMSIDS